MSLATWPYAPRPLTGRSLLTAAVLVTGTTLPPAAPPLGASRLPDTVQQCQSMFDAKDDTTWRAADGNVTLPLPGGRIAWFFGDTLRRDRPPVRNSVLVEEGDRLTSTTGGQAIPDDSDGDFYWPTDAISDGGLPRVFVGRMTSVSGTFQSRGVALATFRFDARGYPVYRGKESITSSSEDLAVQWGASVVRSGDHVYVYGQRRRQGAWIFGRDVYLARVPVGRLVDRSAWRYWSGSRWLADPSRAFPVEKAESGRFASSFTVDRVGTSWVAISKENDFLGDRIIRMEAARPMGPFTTMTEVATPNGRTRWAYQAKGHPELPLSSGRLLVTWNVGTTDTRLLFGDVFPKPRCGEQ